MARSFEVILGLFSIAEERPINSLLPVEIVSWAPGIVCSRRQVPEAGSRQDSDSLGHFWVNISWVRLILGCFWGGCQHLEFNWLIFVWFDYFYDVDLVCGSLRRIDCGRDYQLVVSCHSHCGGGPVGPRGSWLQFRWIISTGWTYFS